MTTATLPRLAAARTRPHRFVQLATDVFEGIMEGREMARRYDRLERMSNAELARLGLTRQDIPRAAVNGAAGL